MAEEIRPETCAACGEPLDQALINAGYTAHGEDLATPQGGGMDSAYREELRRDYTEPGADHSCLDYYDEHIYGWRFVWSCTRCGRVLVYGKATAEDLADSPQTDD